MKSRNRSIGILVLLLIIGVVIGGIIGDLLGQEVEFLSRSYPIGLKTPILLDLSIINLTFGLMIDINVASVIGLIIAIIVYKKI